MFFFSRNFPPQQLGWPAAGPSPDIVRRFRHGVGVRREPVGRGVLAFNNSSAVLLISGEIF